MKPETKIPQATTKRLPLYYRFLKNFATEGKKRISSQELSDAMKIDSATIRRDFSGVTTESIPDYQFQSKKWLTDIVLPDGLEIVGNRAFQGCSRLTGTLVLPESFNKFGDYSMNGTKFSEVILSSDVSVGDHSFDNCTLLKSISSEFITSIGSQAFIDCKSLESFSTSSKLKSIGAFAFKNCSDLKNLVMNEGVEI